MKFPVRDRLFVLILGAILIFSFVNIFSPIMVINECDCELSLHSEPFRVATTYTPGTYPGGLTIFDGDILDTSGGGSYNVTGTFTIMSGATVSIVPGYKIVVYADNIVIAGVIDGDASGYAGGSGTSNEGNPGYCIPSSGRGGGGQYQGGGGGGGAYGSNGQDGQDAPLAVGGSGGLEYGQVDLVDLIPTISDTNLGAGGGGGGSNSWFDFGGSGGRGGGCLYLEAVDTIMINGTIKCDGGSGLGGTYDPNPMFGAGGGGGGAGGGILLIGGDILLTGTLTTQGGIGGSGAYGTSSYGGDGGAGSGGRIKLVYKYSLNTTGATINEGSGGTFYTYLWDVIEPTISLSSPMNCTMQKSDTPIVIDISDQKGLQSINYNWDGNPNTTLSLSNSSYRLTALLPAPDGEHVLDVSILDIGNNSHREKFIYTTDDTCPTITLKSPLNNTIHQSGSLITFTVFDAFNVSQILYNWDGLGGNVSISEPYDIPLPSTDGLHNLTIYVCDLAENWNSRMYSFVTDDTNPSCTKPSDITYIEGTSGNTITWTLSDTNPDHYAITLDGGAIDSGTWSNGMEVNTSVDGLAAGVYVYTLILYDIAGNLVTDTVLVTVLTSTTTTTPTTSVTTSVQTTSVISTTTSTSTSVITTSASTTSTTHPTSSETQTTTSSSPDMGLPIILIVTIGLGITSLIVIVVFIFKRRS